MRACPPPRIVLSVHNRQAIVRDVEAAVFVDGVCVGRAGDVEGPDTDERVVLQGYQAGD